MSEEAKGRRERGRERPEGNIRSRFLSLSLVSPLFLLIAHAPSLSCQRERVESDSRE